LTTETDAYIRKMLISNPLMEPVVRSAIQALKLPFGSHGLDAGCGIGLQTVLLADAVGPSGHVSGVDIVPEFLLRAEGVVRESGLSERISFGEGDVRQLPFDNDSFDWAWSACCVGYAASVEPLAALAELARVVKSGGRVAILAWSSETLLPGYPLLEARLGATSSGVAPFAKGWEPERHFMRALGWFRAGGLEEITVRTFVGDANAPLSADMRSALTALFDMRWPGAESELADDDRSEYQRLCLPESPDFILNHPDYYAFYTCSMFSGTVGA
jgi:ubiquinone/menaquinone biosynthesis C-methylase UbiE